MRIDRIIEKITRFLFSPKYILEILNGKYPLRLKLFVKLIALKKKIFLKRRWSFAGLQNIEWLAEYNIPKESFDTKTKKMGISAIARLKNGEEFLETCVRAILPFVDEVILLVDVNGTDETENICRRLSEEFGEKCQFFRYEPQVYPWNHPKYRETPDNSVHALSYFYNFCLSKANYRYVFKMDDDMLVIPENFQKMTDFVRQKQPQYFLALPQINVSKNEAGEYMIATKYLHSGIAGLFGDHGIFPVSEKTYFFNDVGCENLVFSYRIEYGDISFLHLKHLKHDGGTKNYDWYALTYLEELKKGSEYIPLPEKYAPLLTGMERKK